MMTEAEWFACREPDLMLEFLIGNVSKDQLVEFVRQCWQRIRPLVTAPPHDQTVIEQFAAIVDGQSNFDVVTYANEAALKAAGWAPSIRKEQARQAELLRRIVGNPFHAQPRPERTSRG
jgi:hypothetical protein